MSHVTAIICESNFGLFLAAPLIQHSMQFCNRNTLVQLPTAEDLINVIASIIGTYLNSIFKIVLKFLHCQQKG